MKEVSTEELKTRLSDLLEDVPIERVFKLLGNILLEQISNIDDRATAEDFLHSALHIYKRTRITTP